MNTPHPTLAIIARLAVAAGLALSATGCASRLVDVTEPAQNQRRAASDQSDPDGEPRQRGHADYPSGRHGDPRQFRTADGRPAPYGRDPETGRPINDTLPPPKPLAPPRSAAASLPPPASIGTRPPASPAAPKVAATSVVVAKGDTLHNLAKRHNLKVDDLKRANGLTTDQIKIGQKLTIPGA